jgi:hypothetical protein
MLTNLVEREGDAARLAIGAAVEVCFEKATEDITLYKFRLAASA